MHYRNGKSAADAVVQEIADTDGKAVAVQAELASEAGSQSLIDQAVEAFGRVDVLINNAGTFPNASLLEMSLEDWQSMYSANVETAMLCTQAAAKSMMAVGRGAIVNIASISASNPGPDHSHYNSAKAAVVMLTRSAARRRPPGRLATPFRSIRLG